MRVLASILAAAFVLGTAAQAFACDYHRTVGMPHQTVAQGGSGPAPSTPVPPQPADQKG